MDRVTGQRAQTPLEQAERIAYLERKFQRLQEQQRHQERLEDLNRLLLKNALQELDASRQRAESANQAKTDFLANMSHEIRTPLNILLGMGELLATTELSDTQRQFVSKAQGAGHHLLELINNVLDFSKIERGSIHLVEEAFSLSGLCNSLAGIFQTLCQQKGLNFTYSCTPDLLEQYCGDQAKLRQVLLNLLGNAVKYTDSGYVHFTVETSNNSRTPSVLFTIEDTGIGISDQDREMIFDRFSQVESAVTKTRQGGVGLGLAIVRHLVEKMGGAIELTSEVGEGSCFELHLPLPPALEVGRRQPQIASKAGQEGCLPGLSLLVVDDVPGNLFVVEHFLEGLGMQVTYATSGRQAVELCRQHEFQAILMDVCMPEIDGVEALRQIRRLEAVLARRPAFIAAMTAHAFQEIKTELWRAGFSEILTKPFARDELLAVLAGWKSPRQKRQVGEEVITTNPGRKTVNIPAALLPLVPVLLEKLSSEHADLDLCLSRGEMPQLAKMCHANKGVASMYGFIGLASLYGQLEVAAGALDQAGCHRKTRVLWRYLAGLCRQYQVAGDYPERLPAVAEKTRLVALEEVDRQAG